MKQKRAKENENIETDEVVFEGEESVDFGGGSSEQKLRDRLKKCTEEKQGYLDGWQRSKADFVNLKKEHAEQIEKLKDFANEDLICSLLPIVESFDMAFVNKDVWESVDENWRVGIEYIHTQLMGVLEAKGLKTINPVEEKFDHNKHDSMGIVESDTDKKNDVVAEVVQKGYELNGKVLKAAKVKVYN